MKTLKFFKTLGLSLILIGLALGGCKKETLLSGQLANKATTENEKPIPFGGTLTLRLFNTSPMNAVYRQANVEINKVQIAYDKPGETVWITLTETPRVYDLLQFTALSTIMVDHQRVHPGIITRVRLFFGSNNSLVKYDLNPKQTWFPLIIPAPNTSGLEVPVSTQINNGDQRTITLNFMANASISNEGDGIYILTPIIKQYKPIGPVPFPDPSPL